MDIDVFNARSLLGLGNFYIERRHVMTKDEALKLALKALETLLDSFQRCEAGYPQHIEMRFAVRDTARIAIDRAKEALAQPEHGWTPERIAGMARLKDAQDKRLAQPEQEPVAWYRDEDGIRIYYETKCWDDATPLYTAPQPWEKFCDSNCVWTDHHPDCKLAEPEPVAWKTDDVELYVREDKFGFYNIPLYTTPPQRKPLTDEEIILIVAECASSHQHTDIHFARAIEAAHGIKGLV